MLASERQNLILSQVTDKSAVSIRDLSKEFGVSRETIRKDISILSGDSKVEMVRGGAIKVSTFEPSFATRSDLNREGKNAIAKFVAKRIPDGASVIIDSGSTTQAAAHQLAKNCNDLLVYTNDLTVAQILTKVSRELIFIGGRVSPTEMAAQGHETIEALQRYHAEFALIGVGGLSAEAGLTDFTFEGAALRNVMLSNAQQSFLLADHTKFGSVGQVGLAKLPLQARLVIDRPLPTEIESAQFAWLRQIDVVDL